MTNNQAFIRQALKRQAILNNGRTLPKSPGKQSQASVIQAHYSSCPSVQRGFFGFQATSLSWLPNTSLFLSHQVFWKRQHLKLGFSYPIYLSKFSSNCFPELLSQWWLGFPRHQAHSWNGELLSFKEKIKIAYLPWEKQRRLVPITQDRLLRIKSHWI